MARPDVAVGEGRFQVRRTTANILNKHLWTAEKCYAPPRWLEINNRPQYKRIRMLCCVKLGSDHVRFCDNNLELPSFGEISIPANRKDYAPGS
jgi:hypothetical protein